MAFFRFPYTTFNQVNLDWIMRTIKKLEPAATMVEEADAALQEAQQTAASLWLNSPSRYRMQFPEPVLLQPPHRLRQKMREPGVYGWEVVE